MNFRWMTLFLIIGTWTLQLKAAEQQNPAFPKLSVKESVELRRQGHLWLKDLVELNVESEELSELLSQIKVGKIPEPGEKLEFTHSGLSQIFRAHLGTKNQILLNIPGRVRVKNVSHLLNQEDIQKQLLDHWHSLCGDCELSVPELNVPRVEVVGVSWRLRLGEDLPRGNFSVPLEVLGKTTQTFWVHGRMEVRRLVPVSRRALGFGERISEGDVSWEMRDVTLARDSFPSPDQLIGSSLRAPIASRGIIYSGQLERPRAVHRGQLIRVIKAEDAWAVSTQAVSEQDGFVGDRVTLRHPQTQRLLSGLVTGEGEVELR